MTVRTLTIADLCLSPYNARTDVRATAPSPAMQASILKLGLILPLAVHPMLGSKKFGVFDGGRRYRAIKALVGKGELPADWPVDVSIRQGDTEAELLEISTAAGLLGQQLRSHEVMAALAKAVRRGATVEEIVQITGQEPLWVRRHLRLGNLVQPVFEAFVGEEISEEQAKAFAAVEDHALQLRAWEQLQMRPPFDRAPDVIRKLLKVGDAEQAKLLRFVGETSYRAAGGRYEMDLFADVAEARGLVSDPGILVDLVDAKLTVAKERLRHRAGRDLRFATEYPRHSNYGGVDQELEVRPELAPIAEEDVKRAEFLEEEQVELEHSVENLERSGGSPAEIDALQAERASHGAELVEIDDRRSVRLPAGEIYASLKIEDSGQLEVRWWWESRKAKRTAQEASAPARSASAGP
ncbi:MAG: ParB/RepB/Spo0J family partition protein, partial [Pseudomonadota bacterium]|nr:ParB/RepB/Spo0J family partition protein [Pseudomonadota bacterium]